MSDATAVPLRPVSRSGIAALWIGLAVLVIGAIAWALTLSAVPRVDVDVVRAGSGAMVSADDVVLIKYEGRLPDGTVFDSADRAPLDLAAVVPGFTQGLIQTQVGGKYTLNIPAELGYGSEGAKKPDGSYAIPPDTDIAFDVEVLDKRSRAEVQAMQQQQQMMQQMMQQQGGAPGGPPGGPPGAAPPQ